MVSCKKSVLPHLGSLWMKMASRVQNIPQNHEAPARSVCQCVRPTGTSRLRMIVLSPSVKISIKDMIIKPESKKMVKTDKQKGSENLIHMKIPWLFFEFWINNKKIEKLNDFTVHLEDRLLVRYVPVVWVLHAICTCRHHNNKDIGPDCEPP